jgi:hypothetical protein
MILKGQIDTKDRIIWAQIKADFQDSIGLKMTFAAYPRRPASLDPKRIYLTSTAEIYLTYPIQGVNLGRRPIFRFRLKLSPNFSTIGAD